jgi:pilus assembly protein CpaB
MNQRFASILIFAFVVAAGASFLLYRLLGSRAPAARPPATRVILATHDLEPGALVKEADFRFGDWGVSLSPGVLRRKEDVLDRGVVAAIYSGEPILEARLAPKGAGAGLAALIPTGMRAVAVRVNEIVGVAGFVLPGMHVDVLISGVPPGKAGGESGTLTRTLLQNIEVLSAGHKLQKDTEGKPVTVQVINLLVTPGQAEMLSLAGSQTTIQLVLRNPLDHQIASPPGTGLAKLFGVEAPSPSLSASFGPVRPSPRRRAALRPAPVPAPKPFVIEVIQGTKRTKVKIDSGEDQR